MPYIRTHVQTAKLIGYPQVRLKQNLFIFFCTFFATSLFSTKLYLCKRHTFKYVPMRYKNKLFGTQNEVTII